MQFPLLNPVENAINSQIYRQCTIPKYMDDSVINQFESLSTATLINDLLSRNVIKKITESKRQQFNEQINILNNKKSLILCHISPNKITDKTTFQFTFNIIFGPYHNSLSNSTINSFKNNNFDCSKYKKIYYYYELDVSRTHLKLIHDIISDTHDGKNKYFATKIYPIPLENTIKSRCDKITLEMSDENKYLLCPTIPKGKTLFRKKADYKDALNHAMCLEKVFSSLTFCVENDLYDLLKIDISFKELIQHSAYIKLKALNNISNKDFIRNPFKLTQKRGIEYHFHSLYIVERPINRKNNISFGHWALKFEGNNNLLTIEFFDDPNNDHGIIKIRI
eukprot:253331_1